ncbi:MAG: hypothetical protein E7269_08305 [Lachnospiraceae bacterium]|nr:hypothetical protein [Lachnospiraceae bacterium]
MIEPASEITCEVYKIADISPEFSIAIKYECETDEEKYIYFCQENYQADNMEEFLDDSGLSKHGMVEYIALSYHGIDEYPSAYYWENVETMTWKFLKEFDVKSQPLSEKSDFSGIRIYLKNTKLNMNYLVAISNDGGICIDSMSFVQPIMGLTFFGTEERVVEFVEQLKEKKAYCQSDMVEN